MTGRSGVVYDRGYVPHEGPRLGRSAAIWATIRDGVRRVLGLRRRARKKVLPWGLLIIALLPAVVIVAGAFFASEFGMPESDSPFGDHRTYFGWVGTLMFVFAGLAGPELLVPDRVEGVLAVYGSRPLRVTDYLGARAGAMAITLGGFILVPQLVIYFGFAALGNEGFGAELVSNLDELWKIGLVGVTYIVAYGAPALLVAVYARRTATATGVYIAFMFVAGGFVRGLLEEGVTGGRYAALAVLTDHPHAIRDWIYGGGTDSLPERAGWSPWISVAIVAGVAVATAWLAIRRYRREM